MKAVLVSGDRFTVRTDLPRPIRGAGEALIKVTVAGVCTSDWEVVRGTMEFNGIPGHEFAGVVEDADNFDLIGARVVGEINSPCGHCELCRMGLGRHCRSRTTIGLSRKDGSFAEYLTLPERNLHRVPDDMPDDVAVFAEPVSTAVSAVEKLKPGPHDRAAVIGEGWLGLIVAELLAARCKVILLGYSQQRMQVARGLGFDVELADAYSTRNIDMAIETTGTGAGFRRGLLILNPGGKLGIAAMIMGDTPMPLWKISGDEIQLIGLRGAAFPKAIDALKTGAVKTEKLVTDRFRLDDFPQAITRSHESDAIKVLLYPAGLP